MTNPSIGLSTVSSIQRAAHMSFTFKANLELLMGELLIEEIKGKQQF